MKIRTPLFFALILAAASTVVQTASIRVPGGAEAKTSEPGEAHRAGAVAPAAVSETGVVTSALDDRTSTQNEVRLLDSAGDGAVFREGGAMRRVRIGEQVPGSVAKLRHVTPTGVLVEFAADADNPALVLSVTRGHAVVRPARDRIVPAVRPLLLTSSVHRVKTDAVPADAPAIDGSER